MQHSKWKAHGGRNLPIVCAPPNNHSHLFFREIKGTPADEPAEVRAGRPEKAQRRCLSKAFGKHVGCEDTSPETNIPSNLERRTIRLPVRPSSCSSASWNPQQMTLKGKHVCAHVPRNGDGMCILQMSIRLSCERTVSPGGPQAPHTGQNLCLNVVKKECFVYGL